MLSEPKESAWAQPPVASASLPERSELVFRQARVLVSAVHSLASLRPIDGQN